MQHAHALLDSTLDVKTEPSERGAGLNDEGFKIRTLNLVRGMRFHFNSMDCFLHENSELLKILLIVKRFLILYT